MIIKKELKRLFAYGIGNIAQAAMNFLLLPIFLSEYTPAEYGILNVLLIGTFFLSLFISAGLTNSIQSEYFKQVDLQAKKTLSGNVCIWYVLISVLLLIVLIPFSESLSVLLFSADSLKDEVALSLYTIPLVIIIDIPFNILRMEKRVTSYIVASLVRLIIEVILKYLFIVSFGRGISGYFEATIIALVITNILLYLLTIRYISFILKLDQLWLQLKLGGPLIISGFMIWSLESVDRLMLKFLIDEVAVGTYSASINFAKIFNILLYRPISLLLPPLVFSYFAKHKEEESVLFLTNLLGFLVIIGCALVIGVSLGSADLINILVHDFGCEPNYIQSISSIPFVTLGLFFYYLTMPANYIALLCKRTDLVAKVSVITALCNLILNYFLILLFGIEGAALATAISYFIFLIILYRSVQRVYKVNFNISAIGQTVVFVLIVFFALSYVEIANFYFSIVFKPLTGIAVFLIFTWFFSRIIHGVQKDRFLQFVRSLVSKLFLVIK